ncbi:hypothetical protein BS50DRAFT_591569 [Corynespora cassiicola Philippines]|uniref:SnoaL-like domain-containing protein n=1 Tax=Corynespora cassiicola Philippines TaxID=1448308 RepID=A0A2T2NDG0_CORCC|nr:hypothetical protein BS50DRAFT_591569 [Corynespora cassiicola Philippines]
MQLLLISLFAASVTSISPSLVAGGPPYCPPRPATDQQKRAIFEEFYTKIYINYQPYQASNDHLASDYIQHSPSALSGRDNNLASLSFINPANINFTIRFAGIDGNIGYIYSRADINGQDQPSAIADFLRFNGTCIQEHWDVVQEMPANRTNPLTMW